MKLGEEVGGRGITDEMVADQPGPEESLQLVHTGLNYGRAEGEAS